MGPTQKIVWNIYVGVLGAVTTIVAQKVIEKTWTVVTGEEPPSPTDPDTPTYLAVTWALASGVGVGLTQLLTKRFAARHWQRQMGAKAPDGKVKLSI